MKSIDPTSISMRDSVYFATSPYGIATSSDGGIFWSGGFTDSGSSNILRYPRIALGTKLIAGGSGVSKSSDSGKTWSPAGSWKNISINSFALSDEKVYAGTSDGLYVSPDSGET
jgi:hypothetical protein